MIKSAKKEKYYGTLAYADGEIRKVISHTKEVTEDSDGIKQTEYWVLKNLGYVSKIVSVEAYKIMTALDTVTAVVKVDGRTHIGHAQCNPSDQFDGAFGRRLALARAMHDHATIRYLEELSNWNGWNDADGDANGDDDEEFVSAGDVDGGTLYCCHCGEPVDADGVVPDSYTDDYYCSENCYYAAGGNVDPDGDDDGDNLCDYCLEEIVTPVYDADGHEYCCEECMQKALEENANEVEDDED